VVNNVFSVLLFYLDVISLYWFWLLRVILVFVFGELCVLGVALLLYLLGLVWCHSFGAVMLFPILC